MFLTVLKILVNLSLDVLIKKVLINKTECTPFVTQYHPALPSIPRLKNILMEKWHLKQNQPTFLTAFDEAYFDPWWVA